MSPKCPVCSTHTRDEALASQGFVLTGVEAIMQGHGEIVTDVYNTLEKYDGHTAITLLAMAFADLAMITGVDPIDAIAQFRRQLNDDTPQDS